MYMNVTEVPILRYLVIVQPYMCYCPIIISSHVGVLIMLEMIIEWFHILRVLIFDMVGFL